MIRSLEEFAARGSAAQKAVHDVLAGKPPVKVKLKQILSATTCEVTCNINFQCPLCGVMVKGNHTCERKGTK